MLSGCWWHGVYMNRCHLQISYHVSKPLRLSPIRNVANWDTIAQEHFSCCFGNQILVINVQCIFWRLTHWGRDKMPAISQTAFSNAFSWMKMYEFRIKFHWSLFPRVQLMIFQHWSRWWLSAHQATSYYLNQWWIDYRHIYASLELNDI